MPQASEKTPGVNLVGQVGEQTQRIPLSSVIDGETLLIDEEKGIQVNPASVVSKEEVTDLASKLTTVDTIFDGDGYTATSAGQAENILLDHPLEVGKTYTLSGRGYTTNMRVYFFDRGQVVGSSLIGKTQANPPVQQYTPTTEISNIRIIAIQSGNSVGLTITSQSDRLADIQSQLDKQEEVLSRNGTNLVVGKKFYTLGDSITAGSFYQEHVVKAKGLDYNPLSTRNTSLPYNQSNDLGWGGSTLCPFICLSTDFQQDVGEAVTPRPVIDRNGNNVVHDGIARYYTIGREYMKSGYTRADYLRDYYTDAELIFFLIGTNDTDAPNYPSYFNLGTANDAPYTGNSQFVTARNAWLADYLDNIVIVNDGPITAHTAQVPIIEPSEVPTFASVFAGFLVKLFTYCPTAKIVGSTIMRNSTDIECSTNPNFANGNAGRTARAQLMADIMRRYNVEFIDLWNECSYNKYNIGSMLLDGVHPTELGYFWLGEKIARHL